MTAVSVEGLLADQLAAVVREELRTHLAGHAPVQRGLLSLAETAHRLHVSEPVVRGLIDDGHLRAGRIPDRAIVRVDAVSVDEFITAITGADT